MSIHKLKVDEVIEECGSPEKINNSPQTAPSKRLERWAHGRYGKTTSGIVIAKAIGIDKCVESAHCLTHGFLSLSRL